MKLDTTGLHSKVQVNLRGFSLLVTSVGNVQIYALLYRDTTDTAIFSNPLFLKKFVDSSVLIDDTSRSFINENPSPPYSFDIIDMSYSSTKQDFVEVKVPETNNNTVTVNASGVSDILVICAEKLNGGSEYAVGNLKWKEVI